MYRALYRKWRPQRFEDVVAQRGIVTALRILALFIQLDFTAHQSQLGIGRIQLDQNHSSRYQLGIVNVQGEYVSRHLRHHRNYVASHIGIIRGFGTA